MVGSDTSGYEVNPAPDSPGTGIPVHRYLLVDQGVHLGEFHYLEGLSQAKAYTFCYVAAVNKIKGAAAGFALRPLGAALDEAFGRGRSADTIVGLSVEIFSTIMIDKRA